MPSARIRNDLIAIVGPTAVGKTEIAINLARHLDGEIVSADSRLFYRGMDIGTAKPTPDERKDVPHHLIDIAEPDETWSLALFQQTAYQIIREIEDRGHLPFLVGGTGQYVRAVVEGWAPPSLTPDHRLRTALEKWGREIGPYALHAKLAVLDPQAAEIIDPRNMRRTIRALEVIFGSGKKFSELRSRTESLFNTLMIGLTRPRQQLYQRIDERIERMIADGLVDEVRRLLDKGFSPELPSLSAIGYHEIGAFIQGQSSLEEAIMLIKRRTRQYVRRQANWFKLGDPRIHWFDLSACGENEILDSIQEKIDCDNG